MYFVAMWHLYSMIGIKRNPARAHNLLQKSAAMRCELAEAMCWRIGVGPFHVEPVHCFEILKRCNAMDPIVQNELGMCYYQGYGVPQDCDQALLYFRQAAKHGLAAAQNNAGCIYRQRAYSMHSVNAHKAARMLQRAAAQGHLSAQYLLGCCYRDGMGVQQDHDTAAYWLHHAAGQGCAPAQYYLGRLAQDKSRDTEAISWYRMAATQGYRAALVALEHDFGVVVPLAPGVSVYDW